MRDLTHGDGGSVDQDEEMAEEERRYFMCYLFLATVQELVIEHLDSTALGSEID